MLLASAVVCALPYCATLVSQLLGKTSMGYLAESWRWPFLLCIPLSLWIYSLRSSLSLMPSDQTKVHRVLRKKPIALLLQAFVLVAFMEVFIYAVLIWLPSYLHSYVGVSSFDARLTNVMTLLIFSLAMIGAGYATRWMDASKFVLIGVGSLVFFSYPLFMLLQSGDFLVLLLTQISFAIMAGCLVGVIFVVLPDLFKDNWQSLGMTVSYSLPTAVFGGTAPLVCAYLIEVTHLLTAPALYIIAFGLFALPVAYHLSLKNRVKTDVPHSGITADLSGNARAVG
jgi:MHS family proline/betaine transporter-like MFS transporter